MSKTIHGIKVNESTEHFEAGDAVVAQYNELGRKIEDGSIVGSSKAIDGLTQIIATHASRHGEPIKLESPEKQTVKKRGRPKKEVSVAQPVNNNSIAIKSEYKDKEIKVTFQNQFGQITLNVVDVLEDDNSSAFGLVFKNKEAVTFVPKSGEHLQVSIHGRAEKVFFPGTQFTWTDKQQVLMILYREA